VENFIFFGRVRTRGSEDTIASGGDAFVHTDIRVESIRAVPMGIYGIFYLY
jgi:hypothetical protein